jgi:hypothetical protein
MRCPYCENELKLNTLIDLVRQILAKMEHCPANGAREIFDREFSREPKQEQETQRKDT